MCRYVPICTLKRNPCISKTNKPYHTCTEIDMKKVLEKENVKNFEGINLVENLCKK